MTADREYIPYGRYKRFSDGDDDAVAGGGVVDKSAVGVGVVGAPAYMPNSDREGSFQHVLFDNTNM